MLHSDQPFIHHYVERKQHIEEKLCRNLRAIKSYLDVNADILHKTKHYNLYLYFEVIYCPINNLSCYKDVGVFLPQVRRHM